MCEFRVFVVAACRAACLAVRPLTAEGFSHCCRFRERILSVKLICLAVFFSASTALIAAGPVIQCGALAAKSFGDDVRITSATLVPPKGNMPEYCDIRGAIWPEAGFAIKLPTDWNERFQMLGNGGTAGTISLGAVDAAVRTPWDT